MYRMYQAKSPPLWKNFGVKKGGGDLVRDRQPPRKFAKRLGQLLFFHEFCYIFQGHSARQATYTKICKKPGKFATFS